MHNDVTDQALVQALGCQWIGPEQDPMKGPIHYCGQKPLYPGKSYCADHVWRVYNKGSGITGKRKIKAFEATLDKVEETEDE